MKVLEGLKVMAFVAEDSTIRAYQLQINCTDDISHLVVD